MVREGEGVRGVLFSFLWYNCLCRATGGELFDYLTSMVKLSEKKTRLVSECALKRYYKQSQLHPENH